MVAYELQLPPQMRIHNVCHVSLLEPHVANPFPSRDILLPPPVEIDDKVKYEVEEVLDSHLRRKRLYYLVKWKEYDISEATWEPASHLTNAPDLVAAFHKKYPHKPKKDITG